MVRATQDTLKETRENLQQELAEVADGIQMDSMALYSLLDGHFVQQKLIPRQREGQVDCSPRAPEGAQSIPLLRGHDEVAKETIKHDDHCPDKGRDTALKRSAGSQNLRLMAHSPSLKQPKAEGERIALRTQR
jgi:hypothetical protein